MRAINAERLRAKRDNHGNWCITPDDLAAWQNAQPAHSAPTVAHGAHLPLEEQTAPTVAHPLALSDDARRAELETLRIGLAVATNRAEAAEARAATAEADRDAWRTHAERLASRAAEPIQAPQPVRRRRWLWSRA